MVVLNREFNDPESLVRGRGEGAADGREDPHSAKAIARAPRRKQ